MTRPSLFTRPLTTSAITMSSTTATPPPARACAPSACAGRRARAAPRPAGGVDAVAEARRPRGRGRRVRVERPTRYLLAVVEERQSSLLAGITKRQYAGGRLRASLQVLGQSGLLRPYAAGTAPPGGNAEPGGVATHPRPHAPVVDPSPRQTPPRGRIPAPGGGMRRQSDPTTQTETVVLGRYRLLERLGRGRLRRGVARARRTAAPRGGAQADWLGPTGTASAPNAEALAAAPAGASRDRRALRGSRGR